MGAEKKDEAATTTVTTTTAAAVATPATAAGATAETAAHEGAESSKPAKSAAVAVDTSKMSTVEILRAKKEERLSRAANATTATKTTDGSATTQSTDAAATAAKGDDEGAEAGEKAELGSKDKSEGGDADDVLVKTIDMAKPGWFDRLKPEQREALDRKYPGISAMANAGKAEAQRYVEAAKRKTATAAATSPVKEETPTAAKETKAEADLSEAIDLLYDSKTKKQGLTMLLSDPDAAEVIDARVEVGARAVVRAVLKQLGVDVDAQVALQPLSAGIELASSKYPQLKTDDSFFDEVDALLREDEETYEALLGEKNHRLIAAAVREASASVVRSRAAKKPATTTEAATTAATATTTAAAATKPATIGAKERRENLERTTQAAKEQTGMVAGKAGSRTSSTQAAEPESTVELLRRRKQEAGYRFIGGA